MKTGEMCLNCNDPRADLEYVISEEDDVYRFCPVCSWDEPVPEPLATLVLGMS